MATTNFMHTWQDGDRLFVNVNGATIEAQFLAFDQQIVTLQFHARVVELPESGSRGGQHRTQPDNLTPMRKLTDERDSLSEAVVAARAIA